MGDSHGLWLASCSAKRDGLNFRTGNIATILTVAEQLPQPTL